MSGVPDGESCTWCGAAVEPGDGFRAYEPAAARRAVFCRLEHIVPWEIQGAQWEPAPDPAAPGREAGSAPDPAAPGREAEEAAGSDLCSHCDAPLDDTAVLLIRHRGEHRIPDGFCSSAHMAAWAKAGGRWQ